MSDWIIRFIKGVFMGAGFILPGVSGAALAIVFGLYQRIITFIANITKDFFKNLLYFLPVGIGGCIGIILVSYPLDYLFKNYEPYLIWGFIGCVIGILPKLWKDAKREGSSQVHLLIMIFTAIIGFIALYILKQHSDTESEVEATHNLFTWLFAGFIVSLTALIPGLSSANILIYLGLMKGLLEGIKALDLFVLIPIIVGAAVCLFPLSKIIDFCFKKAYVSTYHVVIGIVIASTLMIIPTDFDYLSVKALFCGLSMLAGMGLGWSMRVLEERYRG